MGSSVFMTWCTEIPAFLHSGGLRKEDTCFSQLSHPSVNLTSLLWADTAVCSAQTPVLMLGLGSHFVWYRLGCFTASQGWKGPQES